MKLTDNNTSDGLSEGLLLVMSNGNTFTVCENCFSQNASDVACKELGFAGSEPYNITSNRTE